MPSYNITDWMRLDTSKLTAAEEQKAKERLAELAKLYTLQHGNSGPGAGIRYDVTVARDGGMYSIGYRQGDANSSRMSLKATDIGKLDVMIGSTIGSEIQEKLLVMQKNQGAVVRGMVVYGFSRGDESAIRKGVIKMLGGIKKETGTLPPGIITVTNRDGRMDVKHHINLTESVGWSNMPFKSAADVVKRMESGLQSRMREEAERLRAREVQQGTGRNVEKERLARETEARKLKEIKERGSREAARRKGRTDRLIGRSRM